MHKDSYVLQGSSTSWSSASSSADERGGICSAQSVARTPPLADAVQDTPIVEAERRYISPYPSYMYQTRISSH